MKLKKIIRSPKSLIIFSIILVAFFAIDWLTKYFLFDAKDVGPNGSFIKGTEKNYIVFGVRSWPHDNTTILSAFNVSLPLWATYVINFSIAAIIFVIAYTNKSVLLAIGLGIILAGVLGNSLDILSSTIKVGGIKHFVRDIIFLPWYDRGTFNFADVFIVLGAIVVFIGTIVQMFFKDKKTAEEKENEEKNLRKKAVIEYINKIKNSREENN